MTAAFWVASPPRRRQDRWSVKGGRREEGHLLWSGGNRFKLGSTDMGQGRYRPGPHLWRVIVSVKGWITNLYMTQGHVTTTGPNLKEQTTTGAPELHTAQEQINFKLHLNCSSVKPLQFWMCLQNNSQSGLQHHTADIFNVTSYFPAGDKTRYSWWDITTFLSRVCGNKTKYFLSDVANVLVMKLYISDEMSGPLSSRV